MSKKRYYFDGRIADDKLRSLANNAKLILQDIHGIVLVYQKFNDLISGGSYGVPPFILRSDRELIFSPSPVNSCSSPQHGRVASSPETSNKVSLKPLKRNPSVSSIQPKRLHFDSTNNEASLIVTTNPEEQSTPVKFQNPSDSEIEAQKHLLVDNTDDEAIKSTTINRRKQSTPVKIRNASDHTIEAQRHLPGDNIDDEIIQIGITSPILSAADQKRLTPKMRIKQLTPVKVIENATEPLSFPRKNLPFPYYQVDNADTLNFEANNPIRERTVSAREEDRVISSEIDQNCVKFISQSIEMTSNLEAEKQKSVEITEMCSIFPVDDKVSASPDKEVKCFAVPTTGYEKNISLLDKAKAGNNRKSLNPNEETRRMANPGKLEENYFSPVKRAKMHVDTATNDQKNISPGEKLKMVICSDQDSKLGISPNQGSKVSDIFEAKRKPPSPRTIQFRFMPRIIQSAQVVEVETYVSCEPSQPSTISPITNPIPYADCNRLTNSKDKKRSPKETHLSLDSKAGSSKDFSSSAKSPLTSSPIVAKTISRNRNDIISLGKDQLSCESSKESPPTKSSLEATSSPIIKVDCLMRLYTLENVREVYLGKFYNNLLVFRRDLKRLFALIGDMKIVVEQIFLYKDCKSKEFKECIIRLRRRASKLMGKICSWKMDVDLEIPSCANYLQQTHRIKIFITSLQSNVQQVTIELLRAHEKDLNEKWKKIEEIIPTVNSRMSLFLSTAVYLETLTNRFVTFLIYLEILKPSPIPTL